MRHEDHGQLTLYSYWRSSAAYRVRIALHLKELDFETIPVHLVRQGGEQHAGAYRSINPQGLVPALLHGGHVLTQSMSICEYLDECFGAYPLLPTDPLGRARIRSLALQIACEIHPLNNLRVQNYLRGQWGDAVDTLAWMRHWMHEGFTVIERQLAERRSSQPLYHGETPGLFECFLVPQVYNAERYGMDMAVFPVIREIVAHCRGLTAFIKAAPENQPDAEPL
ncbi:MAG TPA: maleylacetoacetate isomerase [Xanthomonadales bacterium]